MWAFRAIRSGYKSRLDEGEAQTIRNLARDVATMLGVNLEEEIAGVDEAQLARLEGEEVWDGEDELLAAYAEELSDLALESSQEETERTIPMDEALLRLLPDMSEDPDTARELRLITQENIATKKIDNLMVFFRSLPEGEGEVRITNSDLGAWLGACNDIRLVLAARLEIDSDERGNEVYARASEMTGTHDGAHIAPIENAEDLMMVLYAMLSWWQESLLMAHSRKAWLA